MAASGAAVVSLVSGPVGRYMDECCFLWMLRWAGLLP